MWNKHDTLCFTLDSCYVGKLSNNKLNLEIEIRNTNQYPFRNLLLCISHLQKDQKTIQTDTLNLQLANSNNHWLGSGWGGIYTTIAEPITIEISANNPFIKITHFMNTEELEGIHDVGIKIEE